MLWYSSDNEERNKLLVGRKILLPIQHLRKSPCQWVRTSGKILKGKLQTSLQRKRDHAISFLWDSYEAGNTVLSWICRESVSYTHLDVYKRQVFYGHLHFVVFWAFNYPNKPFLLHLFLLFVCHSFCLTPLVFLAYSAAVLILVTVLRPHFRHGPQSYLALNFVHTFFVKHGAFSAATILSLTHYLFHTLCLSS